jgi:hypothetical protein
MYSEGFWSRLGFKEAYTRCAKLKLMQSKKVAYWDL